MVRWSETAILEGAPAVSAELHGWGFSVSRSEDFQLSAVTVAAAGVGCSRICTGTAAARTTLSTASRRVLHTGADLLTDRQQQRLTALFGADEHIQVEATWGIYQRMIGAYREPDRAKGRKLMSNLIDALGRGVPAALTEIITLGRTLKKRAEDVLAYFDRPGTSNGPTEALNGRLEHLRGSALGFRNLTNYIARSLLETGGFRPRLHPQS